MQKNLLEELAERLHCTYLSDLHRADLRPSLATAVGQIPADTHSLREWCEAVSYLVDSGAQEFESAQQAKDFFLRQLVSPSR